MKTRLLTCWRHFCRTLSSPSETARGGCNFCFAVSRDRESSHPRIQWATVDLAHPTDFWSSATQDQGRSRSDRGDSSLRDPQDSPYHCHSNPKYSKVFCRHPTATESQKNIQKSQEQYLGHLKQAVLSFMRMYQSQNAPSVIMTLPRLSLSKMCVSASL